MQEFLLGFQRVTQKKHCLRIPALNRKLKDAARICNSIQKHAFIFYDCRVPNPLASRGGGGGVVFLQKKWLVFPQVVMPHPAAEI
jgi:hypothetical protein